MRLVECLLDRRRDPAPIADVVAVLAGPFPHRLGVLAGLPTARSLGAATGAATVAVFAALDLPGAFDESADGSRNETTNPLKLASLQVEDPMNISKRISYFISITWLS